MRNPHLNRISGLVVDLARYQAELIRLGVTDPWFIQFARYIGRFFTGDWSLSFIIAEGTPVTELMRNMVPGTIETMFLPIIIGLIGIILGRIVVRKRDSLQGLIIRIFTIIGLAMPIFFMATLMQLNFHRILPVLYRSDPSIPASPFITGFPLFDSIISGNWKLAGSIIEHGILPTIALSFVVITLVIKQTQTNIERSAKDTFFVSNSFMAGKIFGILFALVLMVEISFNIRGFAYYFYLSIISGDFLFLIGCIFMIIILFSFTVFFSNIIPIAYKFFRKKVPNKIKIIRKNVSNKLEFYRKKIYNKFKFSKSREEASSPLSEPKIEVEINNKTKLMTELKNYVITTLKNPFAIVGLGLLIFLIVISAFPQLLTPYSLNEIIPPYIPLGGIPFEPPSPDHPLGTTLYGYDILARIIYGTRDALIFGIIITLIGLAVGSIFGYIAGSFHRYIHNGIIGSMVIFFIIPGLMILILSIPLFGGGSPMFIIVMIIGLLLAVTFTGIVGNAIRRETSNINTIKAIIKYIPLEMAFGIMLYQMLGFLGLTDETIPQLGVSLNYGRGSFSAFEATYWPGIYLFVIMLSLILLHEGLDAPTGQRDILNAPVISS